MVVAVRVISIKSDIRIPVLGCFSKIKYVSSIKYSLASFLVNYGLGKKSPQLYKSIAAFKSALLKSPSQLTMDNLLCKYEQ